MRKVAEALQVQHATPHGPSKKAPHTVLRPSGSKSLGPRGKTVPGGPGVRRSSLAEYSKGQVEGKEGHRKAPSLAKSWFGELEVRPDHVRVQGLSMLGRTPSGSSGVSDAVPALGMPAVIDKRQLATTAIRQWLKVDTTGQTSIVHAHKHSVTDELGVQVRDLRILDPAMSTSYPSAILCRDKALLVNLEHIKCIITSQYVLVLNADQDGVLHFVEELQRRLRSEVEGAPSPDPRQHPLEASGRAPSAAALVASKVAAAAAQVRAGMLMSRRTQSDPDLGRLLHRRNDAAVAGSLLQPQRATEDTPFELRVLETALDVVCSRLLEIVVELEKAGEPVLRSPTAHTVTTLLLDKMRRLKNRLNRVKTRVERLREILEKLLADDADMKQMSLTARQQADLQRASLHRPSMESPFERVSMKQADPEDDDPSVAQVQGILEPWMFHVDNTCNKVNTMNEFIDDLEEFIDLEINNFRNNLISTRMGVNAATGATALIFSFCNLFGMNLNYKFEGSYLGFVLVSVLSSAIACILLCLFYAWCISRKLLPNPLVAAISDLAEKRLKQQ